MAMKERPYGGRWKPSIHMFRKHSRINLEVVGVRVERVLDISESDARAEGCVPDACNYCASAGPEGCEGCRNTGDAWPARQEFESLWQSINAKRGFGWDINPWLWCMTFKRVDAEVSP